MITSSPIPGRRAATRQAAAYPTSPIVIDTCVPPGDAAWLPGDGESTGGSRVAPLSTIASCHAWNLVLVTLAELARTAAIELPIWISSNVTGGDKANARLLSRYGDRVVAL